MQWFTVFGEILSGETLESAIVQKRVLYCRNADGCTVWQKFVGGRRISLSLAQEVELESDYQERMASF